MARTHNDNDGENNNAGNPPPSTIEQLLMMQAQMLQTMKHTTVNMKQNQQAPQPQQRDRLGDFQRTKPPSFSHSIEPMDADNWLKIVEKKLQIVQCNNREKVILASHQLIGPTADWWDAYMEAHEEPNNNNWNEFKAIFRSHHVPQGIMKLKKKEFQHLNQGSMTVSEYVTRFTQLSPCS
jgi:isochorismate synthase EntC